MENIIGNDTFPLQNVSTIFNTTDLSEEQQDPIVSALNIISSTICVIGLILNIQSIIALAHTPKDFRNESKLIVSLSMSDMLILLAVLCHEVLADSITAVPSCISIFNMILTHTSYLATLLNLAMMALQLYFCTNHVYTYQKIVTNFKTNLMVLLVWVVSISIPLSEVFVGLAIMKTKYRSSSQFCQSINHDDFRTDNIIIHAIFVVIVIMIITYIKVANTGIRMHQRDRLQNRNTSTNKRKMIVTTGLFILTFLLSWVPYGAFHLSVTYTIQYYPQYVPQHIVTIYRANKLLSTFFLLNSIADPLIYALRLKKVRKGYRLFFNKVFKLCLFSSSLKHFRNKRAHASSERRKTISTTISGQDWLNHDDGSPTMIHHNSPSSHDDINGTTVESEMILEPLDWTELDRSGSPDKNTCSIRYNKT